MGIEQSLKLKNADSFIDQIRDKMNKKPVLYLSLWGLLGLLHPLKWLAIKPSLRTRVKCKVATIFSDFLFETLLKPFSPKCDFRDQIEIYFRKKSQDFIIW